MIEPIVHRDRVSARRVTRHRHHSYGSYAGGAPHHATPGSLDPTFDGGDPG